jgi:chromate transport protein ChrA
VSREAVRTRAARLLIDYRGATELVVAAALVVTFLVAATAGNFPETMSAERRGTLYGSLAGTSGALLGFVLAALSILVALPSSDRVDALRDHPKWERVPSSYFRAARALLAALALCTLGIALDSAKTAWQLYEAVSVAVLALCLVRVAAAVVALDGIIGVARQRKPLATPIDDPGL